MDPFKKKLIILGGILVIAVGGIIGYSIISGRSTTQGQCNITAGPKRVALTWWGDLPPAAVQGVIDAYVGARPYVSITYTQLDPKQTEQQLINAWARNTGPDIFSVKNEQLKHFVATGLVTPMPASTTSYTYTHTKVLGIKDQLQICKVDRPVPSVQLLQNTFVSGAVSDIYQNGKVVGFPLQFDSLAMLYNQQLLDEAGVLTPPATWTDMVKTVPKLTLLDDKGEIVRAGAALGRSTNVPNMPEILTAIFREYGIAMTDASGTTATFANGARVQDVLNVAASFGNPTKENYTWNDTFPSALDALAQGKVAVAFGTQADLAAVQTQTTGADIRVAAFPQANPQSPTYVADYYVQTVATKVSNANVAWDFLRFAADASQVQSVTKVTGGIPAIRTLVQKLADDQSTTSTPAGVFAAQAATATGWFPGTDPTRGRQALGGLIDAVATQQGTISDAMDLATRLYTVALTSTQ